MSAESAKADQETAKPPLRSPDTVRTLNFDPALSRLGWSVTDLKMTSRNKENLVQVVRWGNLTPSAQASRVANAEACKLFTKRVISLRELRVGVRELIQEFQPDYITVEDTFFSTAFPSAFAALEQVITTITLLCHDEFQKPIYRIPTKCAKQAVTASGAAKKGNVLTAIRESDTIIFKQKKKAQELDHHSADSIAVGVHFLSRMWPEMQAELGAA